MAGYHAGTATATCLWPQLLVSAAADATHVYRRSYAVRLRRAGEGAATADFRKTTPARVRHDLPHPVSRVGVAFLAQDEGPRAASSDAQHVAWVCTPERLVSLEWIIRWRDVVDHGEDRFAGEVPGPDEVPGEFVVVSAGLRLGGRDRHDAGRYNIPGTVELAALDIAWEGGKDLGPGDWRQIVKLNLPAHIGGGRSECPNRNRGRAKRSYRHDESTRVQVVLPWLTG